MSGRTTKLDEGRRANGVRVRSCQRYARFTLVALLLEAAAAFAGAPDTAPLELLTNAQQVLALGVEGASRAPHPVRLRAVVTCPVIGRPWFYAQDATAGIRPAGHERPANGGDAGPTSLVDRIRKLQTVTSSAQ